jgi:hypothetical protein
MRLQRTAGAVALVAATGMAGLTGAACDAGDTGTDSPGQEAPEGGGEQEGDDGGLY